LTGGPYVPIAQAGSWGREMYAHESGFSRKVIKDCKSLYDVDGRKISTFTG